MFKHLHRDNVIATPSWRVLMLAKQIVITAHLLSAQQQWLVKQCYETPILK